MHLQRRAPEEAQIDVLACILLKARDKDHWTRVIALETLVDLKQSAMEGLVAIDKLLSIFDANLLNIDGITNPKHAQARLTDAARSCRAVSLTLQLFASFMFGPLGTETMEEDLQDTSLTSSPTAYCRHDNWISTILQRMDDIDLASMDVTRYTAFHAAICYTIISNDLADKLLQQALLGT